MNFFESEVIPENLHLILGQKMVRILYARLNFLPRLAQFYIFDKIMILQNLVNPIEIGERLE